MRVCRQLRLFVIPNKVRNPTVGAWSTQAKMSDQCAFVRLNSFVSRLTRRYPAAEPSVSRVPLAQFLALLGMTATNGVRQLQGCFFPLMSVGHERRNKTHKSQCAARFAARSVPPLHHRQCDFR